MDPVQWGDFGGCGHRVHCVRPAIVPVASRYDPRASQWAVRRPMWAVLPVFRPVRCVYSHGGGRVHVICVPLGDDKRHDDELHAKLFTHMNGSIEKIDQSFLI